MGEGRDEGFLTTEEVLEYLQVNLRTVYRLIKAGKIPAVRVGRQWRFRKRDIDAWLESQRPRGSAARPAAAAPARPRRRRRTRRGCWSSTTRRASAICWRRRSRWRSTTWTSRPTAAPRSSGMRVVPYDLLITDLKMPGVDGLTVIREARRAQGRPAGHHHHRLLDRGERDRGGQPRRLGLPDEALPRARRSWRPPPKRSASNRRRRCRDEFRAATARALQRVRPPSHDPALLPHQIVRRSRPARRGHLADRRPRARRPERAQRRRQDDAAQDAGGARRAGRRARREAVRG